MNQKGLIEIILVAVIAVAALGGIYALDKSRQRVGEERVRKELEPKIVAAEKLRDEAATGRDAAVAANTKLQSNLQTLAAEREACSSAVDKLQRQGVRMKAQQDARKPIDDKKLADIDVDKAELLVALGLADKGGTCEQQLARSTALWKKIAEQRARDFPQQTVAPAGGGSDDVKIKVPK